MVSSSSSSMSSRMLPLLSLTLPVCRSALKYTLLRNRKLYKFAKTDSIALFTRDKKCENYNFTNFMFVCVCVCVCVCIKDTARCTDEVPIRGKRNLCLISRRALLVKWRCLSDFSLTKFLNIYIIHYEIPTVFVTLLSASVHYTDL